MTSLDETDLTNKLGPNLDDFHGLHQEDSIACDKLHLL